MTEGQKDGSGQRKHHHGEECQAPCDGHAEGRRNAKHHVMGMLKGGGMHQLLCLWARGLLLCQLERRERRNSSGRKRRKKGGNNGGGGGRRTRKSISNSIGETRSMLNSDGELRQES